LLRFLIHHFAATSGSVPLCLDIVYDIVILSKFVCSTFKHIHSVSRYNPVRQLRQAVPCISHPTV